MATKQRGSKVKSKAKTKSKAKAKSKAKPRERSELSVLKLPIDVKDLLSKPWIVTRTRARGRDRAAD